ncbi:hypothetical protein ACFW2E_09585, partial [Streptomyces sp. NPDC058964]
MFCTTGNHDEREAFAKALGSGHLDPDGTDRAEAVPGRRAARAAETDGRTDADAPAAVTRTSGVAAAGALFAGPARARGADVSGAQKTTPDHH